MKKLKSIYLGIAALAAAGLGGCQADMTTPELVIPEAKLVPNTTIAELKALYSDPTNTSPVGLKDEASGEHFIIHGRVVSSDASGNIYKSLVIQDETAALAFSINQSSLYIENRLGQDVVVDMTGLYMGYYRGLQQVGWPGTPYDGLPQLGFMAINFWDEHTELNGLPDPEFRTIEIDDPRPADSGYMIAVDNFAQLPASGAALQEMQSQLVELRNVSFVDGGKASFAPYQESVSRTLRDANGAEMDVRNSGYSNFYTDILPEGTGSVRGILSYYGDSYQLILRDRNDVRISDKGEKDEPFTVSDVLDESFRGMSGWVSGYIVGSVRLGVNEVKDGADVILSDKAEMDNNLLIAASPDEKDWQKMVVVELPQGTDFRTYANLVDNPAVYGKSILVNGTLSTFLGMPGVTRVSGSLDSFEIDGNSITPEPPVPPAPGEVPAPKGDGTEASPYNIGAVLAATSTVADVWVEGYVAGFVADSDMNSSAVWSDRPAAGSSSNNYANSSNVILSEKPAAEAGIANSVPAGLNNAVKSQLGLKNNPQAFGRKVRVRGTLSSYLGVRGITKISEVKFID